MPRSALAPSLVAACFAVWHAHASAGSFSSPRQGSGQDSQPSSVCAPTSLPLQGAQKPHFSTNNYPGITQKYDVNRSLVFWDSEHGFYSWNFPFLHPMEGNAAEKGYAQWLRPFRFFQEADGTWESNSYVGTRPDVKDHTSCCCQYLYAGCGEFRITEYCDLVNNREGTLLDSCSRFMREACPFTNESAWSQQSRWSVKPYSESYSTTMRSLNTSAVPFYANFSHGQPLKMQNLTSRPRTGHKSASASSDDPQTWKKATEPMGVLYM